MTKENKPTNKVDMTQKNKSTSEDKKKHFYNKCQHDTKWQIDLESLNMTKITKLIKDIGISKLRMAKEREMARP
jgi:hypothetical protein